MIQINKLIDGTEQGQLRVRVFTFLNRLDTSRSMEAECLKECVTRVFRVDASEGIVAEWLEARSLDC